MEENQETKDFSKVKDFYQNYQLNPTNSYIDHQTIFALIMANVKQEDKLNLLNNFLQPEKPIENLQGWNKNYVIDNVVKPILEKYKDDKESIMMFKADINLLKENSKNLNFSQNEKGSIKFIPAKVSTDDYMKFLTDNRDAIKNGQKNEISVSSSMLLLAYNETSDKGKFHDILIKSGVSNDNATAFIKENVFEHNENTNLIKKTVAAEINSNIENVNTFKKETNFIPNVKHEQENSNQKKL